MRVVLKLINNAKYAHDLVFGDTIFTAELMCAELMLAWATKEYGDTMLSEMSKEMTHTSLEKKPFIEFITMTNRNVKLIYYDNSFERQFFNIFDLKSLMAYIVQRHKNITPSFIGGIKLMPPYADILLNDYLSSLIKIKC